MTKPYMTIESGPKPEPSAKEHLYWTTLTYDPNVVPGELKLPDSSVRGHFIDALRWDYFCQHFYEWVKHEHQRNHR